MAGAWKDDYPPLLKLGFHKMDLPAVRNLCVTRFPQSVTRLSIMTGLEEVVSRLNQSGLTLDIWIDGSFLTEKLNPDDSDIAVRFHGEEYDAADASQKAVLDWAAQTDLVAQYKCDCYPFPEYAVRHPLYDHGQWRRAYWLNKFGHDRQDQAKGLAVVQLPVILK